MTENFPEIHVIYPERRYLSALEIREHGAGKWPKARAQEISAALSTAVSGVKCESKT